MQSFWIRRIYRIFPLAWFWLAFLIVCAIFFNESNAFGSLKANIDGAIYAVLQIANYRFQQCFMSFECGPSFPYWSLSLEEQFYMILPLLVFLFRKYTVYALAVILLYKLYSVPLSFMFAFRFEGLIIGVLLAMATSTTAYARLGEKLSRININYLRVAILLLVLVAFYASTKNQMTSVGLVGFKITACVCGVIVWLASYDIRCVVPSGRVFRMMLWAGSRSFALYLIHIPVFLFVKEISFRVSGNLQLEHVIPYSILVIFLLYLFAEMSFRYIETPFRRKGVVVSKRILNGP